MQITGKMRLVLVGGGFATFLAMNAFSLWGFSFLPQFAFGDAGDRYWITPLTVSNIFAFFGYFLGSTRFPRLFNRAPYPEAVLLMSAGMILLLGFFLNGSTALLIASSILTGIGTTCCFICWEQVFSLSAQREAQKQIIVGSMFSLVPFLLFFVFGQRMLLFTVSLLVLANLVLLYPCLRFPNESVREEHDPLVEPTPYLNIRGQFWKPLLCIVMIGIVSPVLGSTAFTGELAFFDKSILVLGANVAAAAILAVVWLALNKNVTIANTYIIIFPVLITAFLAFPFLPQAYRVLILFIGSLGFTLFSIVMMMSCLTIARERHISLIFVYSLFAGVTYVSRLLGSALSSLVCTSSLSQETQIFTSVFFLLYGCSVVMFILMRKGVSGKEAQEDEGAAPRIDMLEQTCLSLADRHGFSKRQREVLDLLVHGYDVPSIAKKLFISENTVRTHTKRIYTLLEVHSKQEIVDLVNGENLTPASPCSESQ